MFNVILNVFILNLSSLVTITYAKYFLVTGDLNACIKYNIKITKHLLEHLICLAYIMHFIKYFHLPLYGSLQICQIHLVCYMIDDMSWSDLTI